MQDTIDFHRRASFAKIVGVGALGVGALSGVKLQAEEINEATEQIRKQNYININPLYVDSDKVLLPKMQMKLQKDSVGLVVVNPQIDFLSPKGIGWSLYGASIKENNTIQNISMLFRVAKALRLPTFVSYVVWNSQDLKILPKTPMKNFVRGTKLAYGNGTGLNANNIEQSGADFLPEYKSFILDNKTILTTPRKDFGLKGSDLTTQLRISGIKQVILCGMDANVHLDSHLRDLLAEGFEVGIVRDATAGAKLPEGDGYLAGLINFRFIAHELFFTADIVQRLQHM
ncbi:isochorismatase family protein [Helicobacter trogontum]|uniref:Cysteine hydrolase n=1 Tax=Helicobacter trogontum TaxID=50960 RepID=A0A4U8TGR6_9HELI|nr:isochorismatase family protein [Helicobacter trogontum]MDY5185126.1 isochorismatase family protein [Helicobacter trogontum]TLD97947.1 cysteine hydrolase [Helicobacter trogontum]